MAARTIGTPAAALADFERAPGFRVQRELADRLNFTVGGELFGKVYARPSLAARIRQRTGPRPALREADRLARLAAAGISVPSVVAAGEEKGGRSWIVTRALRGEPLDDAIRAGRLEDPRRVARDLARLVRRLHDAGFVHRDLYLCHVFVDGERLALIDVERVLDRRGRRWRVKDLAALLSSLPDPAGARREAIRFLREYLGRGVDLVAWARRVERKAARIRAHVPRRKAFGAAARAQGALA